MSTPPELREEKRRHHSVDPVYAAAYPGTQGDRDRKYLADRRQKYPGVVDKDIDISEESMKQYHAYKSAQGSKNDAETAFQAAVAEQKQRMERGYSPTRQKAYASRGGWDSLARATLARSSQIVCDKDIRFVFQISSIFR